MLLVLGLLAGGASIALGLGLLGRVDTGFGAVGATGFVVLGLIILMSGLSLRRRRAPQPPPERETTWQGEPARFQARATGLPAATTFLTFALLGAWTTAIGVVGAVEQTWLWAVLAAAPAVYFGGFAVLWVAGRFRPGGVWLTPTRVVDEHFGLRSELALADVADLSARSETLHLTPRQGVTVTRQALSPRPWRARSDGVALVIRTADLPGGSLGLAAAVQRRPVP